MRDFILTASASQTASMWLAKCAQCLLVLSAVVVAQLSAASSDSVSSDRRLLQPVCSVQDPVIFAPVGLKDAVRMPHQVHYCAGLKLAFLHIFKNAGSSVGATIRTFCNQTTGQRSHFYAHWADAKLASLRDLCSASVCFTFWRDPVARLLSGYHEIMRRNQLQKTYRRQFLLRTNASHIEKVVHFERFFAQLERGSYKNPHVDPQTKFLVEPGGGGPPNVAVFPLSSLENVLPMMLCGSLLECAPNATCPVELVDAGLAAKARDRSSSSYGLPQFTLTEADLSDGLMKRIVQFYRDDYCMFRIPVHPRGPAELTCP